MLPSNLLASLVHRLETAPLLGQFEGSTEARMCLFQLPACPGLNRVLYHRLQLPGQPLLGMEWAGGQMQLALHGMMAISSLPRGLCAVNRRSTRAFAAIHFLEPVDERMIVPSELQDPTSLHVLIALETPRPFDWARGRLLYWSEHLGLSGLARRTCGLPGKIGGRPGGDGDAQSGRVSSPG